MWLESLRLQHFRNYQELDISFQNGLNVFLGQNAQGKTNILESIYFLALTRSHRTRVDRDLMQFQQKNLSISGLLHRQIGKVPLDIELTEKGRITKVNHLKQSKLSDYIGHMNVVLFAPEDLQLIKGAPALRRKFIDVELGQIKPIYLSDLSNYNHILKQRNTYLKSVDKIDETFLSVLDQQLAEYGSKVILQRLDFLKKLEFFGNAKVRELSEEREELTIQYQSSIKLTETDNLVDTFLTELSKCRKRDLFKKNTGIGPHRDDIVFFLNSINAHYGSQGQHRSLVLALKLAEIELMKEVTRESPILLLDDVMSELDNNRQVKLLETISLNIQTFITTTSLEHLAKLPEKVKIFTVRQGKIEEQ
ncbi:MULTISPECIES: DNA replication/repair protein RecF [unclassified Streptococcus]|uniref:DNA replication/repair protein RecF n=1 Tax=unclassified Streptococcus TaxID=2608887 RepID=UPI00107199A2|nr:MULTISPECIES: DNA replication/repair protein RecF [unclassified Streptococcus]MBF0786925.1 DNA replication/repair protein RecF [Streptococcus sp. 19428wC2_LYSM12]MCQ9211471.1 DNA replication/repair protein RecF [Streptococcus sp. B01]MCQ9214787.1 DNA replication/repair protein RecF [Streptococcus sp. O1]TFV06127.1 DNA replication/repair protein RecF [Streptococcus sp. LYSM12]